MNTSLIDIFYNINRASDKQRHYFSLYEKWFSPWIGKSPRILEIGIQNGGDCEMWLKYFGEGTQIVGVDIDPRCEKLARPGLEIKIGDQGDPQFWDQFADQKFDIIIDDGSHDNDHQILTLNKTFNLLVDGGIYWCEDCMTSYQSMRRDGGVGNSKSFIEYTKILIDVLYHHHYNTYTDIITKEIVEKFYDMMQSIHFYDCIVVIEKGPRFPYQRIIKKAK